MAIKDIRPVKQLLRAKYKKIRRELPSEQKNAKDQAIFNRVLRTTAYQQADSLITYVSSEIEVDTRRLIEQAWKEHKRVLVPRCIIRERGMDFCLIRAWKDLEAGAYAILEPKQSCEVTQDYAHSVCIVPGLAFDQNGYRLGYGKGYYDRFLNQYAGVKIGICYCSCTQQELPHGRYDCAVDLLLTEKYSKTIG